MEIWGPNNHSLIIPGVMNGRTFRLANLPSLLEVNLGFDGCEGPCHLLMQLLEKAQSCSEAYYRESAPEGKFSCWDWEGI